MTNWADKVFGKVCPKCGKRHVVISTPGSNLPKNDYECDFEEYDLNFSNENTE